MRLAAQQRARATTRFPVRDEKPAIVSSSPLPFVPPAAVPASRVTHARTGDLIDIHAFLTNIFHGPSLAEFQAQQDAPGYEPQHRLIIRERHDLIAHTRVSPVVDMQYGTTTIPAAWLMDLATAPEYREQGLASELIVAAEREAIRRGATLLLARSNAVNFFMRRGWHVCGRHSYSLVDPCRLLAAMAEQQAVTTTKALPLKPGMQEVNWYVRPFRMLDFPELLRLEATRVAGRFGAIARDQASWEWLLSRRAYDQMYVVVDHPQATQIAGYVIVAGSRVVELVTDSQATAPTAALLTRVAKDAVEAGIASLRIDGSPAEEYHAWCAAAQGRTLHNVLSGGEAYCVKVLDPRALLNQTLPVWQQRAGVAAESSCPLTLELDHSEVGAATLRLVLDPIAGSVQEGNEPARKARLQMPLAQLGPLVLGQATQPENERALSLAASDKRGTALAAALFPPLPLYYPSFDHLTAR